MRRRKARSRQTVKAAVPLRSPQPREVRAVPEKSPFAEERPEKKLTSIPSLPATPDAPVVAAELGLKVPAILFEGDEPPGPSTANAEIKYALAPTPPAAQTSPEKRELPAAYGTGRLLAVARDPHCLYVHWDLTPEQQKQLNGLFQHHRLFVRLRPEGHVTKPLSEVAVQPEARHWFMPAAASGANYIAELGYYGPGHEWRPVEASPPVRTPSENASAERRVQFATFNPDVPLPNAGDVAGFEHPQTTVTNQPAPQQTAIQRSFPLVPRSAPVGLTETPQSEEPIKVTPASPPTDIAAEDLISEWTALQEQALEALIDWAPTIKESIGSAEIEHLLKREAKQPLVLPAQVSLEAASLEPGPGAAISSPTGGEQLGAGGFWLNVNAELIVYGATDPNARLTLGGRWIQLRPDGTFSYRLALPDGQFELPVTAESASGEMRQVRLVFGRSTTSDGQVGTQGRDPALRRPGEKDAL